MNQEMEFAARLENIRKLAKEQGGLIPDQEVELTATGDAQLSAAISAVQWML